MSHISHPRYGTYSIPRSLPLTAPVSATPMPGDRLWPEGVIGSVLRVTPTLLLHDGPCRLITKMVRFLPSVRAWRYGGPVAATTFPTGSSWSRRPPVGAKFNRPFRLPSYVG